MITITLPKWCAIVLTLWLGSEAVEKIIRFIVSIKENE